MTAASTPHLVHTTACDVTCAPVLWLWPGRIPRAKLTVLDGDPGLGKSTISLDIAARVSSGRRMPFCEEECVGGGVILLSAEDDASDTIVPRLKAAGADLGNVHIIEAVSTDTGRRPTELPIDVPLIESMIRDLDVWLVIVDPIMAYLGSGTDTYRDQDVRRALMPLSELAARSGSAILLIRHLTKSGGGSNPIYRGGGSIGFVAACRSGLIVGRDPDDDEKRVLASTKCNLAPEADAVALGYQIVNHPDLNTATVRWLGPTQHSARDLLSQPDGDERASIDEASVFLLDLLSSGPVRSGEIQKQARTAGIPWITVRRAKSKIGAQSRKESFGGSWIWELPRVEDAQPAHVQK